MKCSCLFLVLLAWVGASSPRGVRAQISSPAFDPNCYFPRIGVPGEIDTIYGSYVGQELGGGLVNIGPSPDNPGGPGRLMFGGLAGDRAISGRGGAFSAVHCGTNFDPHNMSVSRFKGFWSNSKMVFGHYRSQYWTDILLMDSLGNTTFPKIYWADQQGKYDTSRYTSLGFLRKTTKYDVNTGTPFHACLTSDTAEDIVLQYISDGIDVLHDSVMFALYHGGSDLFRPGSSVYPSEEAYFDSVHAYDMNYGSERTGYIGDFRGVGRVDYVGVDAKGSLALYKNDLPFSLVSFTAAMKRDTLLSTVGETRIQWLSRWGWLGVTLPALNKRIDDKSVDLVLYLDSNGGSSKDNQFRIFRGGPDFGSHRLTIDSAYTLHSPSAFDSNTFKYVGWDGLTNCGDMTGTGRTVLGLAGVDENSAVGFEAFYVLGDAIDEKVDMFFGGYIMGGLLDTCTIDGDGLQDLANGDPGYNTEGDLSGKDIGTVRFIHGSKKIPVRLNRVEVRKTNPVLEGAVTVSPNPCSRFTVVTWESSCSGEVHLTLRDLLGKTVFEESRPTTGDLEAFRLDLPPLANGEYFLELQQEPCSQLAKIVVKN